jgi:vitamin B12 transporter
MRSIGLVVITIFFSIAVFSQEYGTTISGKILNKNIGVANIKVSLIHKFVSSGEVFFATGETDTDANGEFKFENLPDRDYQLVWKGVPDAELRTGKIWIKVRNEKPQRVVIELSPSYMLQATVTISSGEKQSAERVSKTVDTIDSQEMRDRADFSLAESLRTMPGFRVQQLGGFGRTANIKTRGLRNQDTAILIDGIRFRDPTAITGDASPFLSDFTLTSVNKIEVLRGSGSSLYGTNAIGGTVDFQTPEAKSGTHGQIGGAFGGLGLGRFRGNISHGTEGGKFGITAGVSRTGYTKGIDGDDNANNTNFQTRVDANPFSKTNISGRIFVSDADVRLNSDPDTAGLPPASNSTIISAVPNVTFVPDVNDPDKTQNSKFLSGQFVVNQIINSKLFLNGYYQRLKTKRTNDNGPLGIPFQTSSTSVYDGTIHSGIAHLRWTPNGKNQFTAGYEFESERFGNDGRTPSGSGDFFTRAGQQSNTFYLQDLVSLLDGDLQLAGGARVQKYSLDRPGFSLLNAPYSDLTLDDPPTAYTFDGAASYFIQGLGTKLRAHVGNGYRVPSLYERFGSFFDDFSTPHQFVAIGDPFLKPEKTMAFDAGIEQNAANDRVRLSATYFYTRLKDIIGFGFPVPDIGNTPRPFGGYENQKGGLARGGEFSVKAKPARTTDIFASYTYTNSDQRTPQVQFSEILSTLGIPDHQFTLVATQRFNRAWVNFDFLAASTYLAPIFSNTAFSTYIYRFNGNRKGDLTVGYTFGFKKEQMTLRVYGTVENIFDQEYFENGFRTAGATARAGMSFGF